MSQAQFYTDNGDNNVGKYDWINTGKKIDGELVAGSVVGTRMVDGKQMFLIKSQQGKQFLVAVEGDVQKNKIQKVDIKKVANDAINLDGSYTSYKLNGNESLQKGTTVQLQAKDGKWTEQMMITDVKNKGNGIYVMTAVAKDGKQWSLTIKVKEESKKSITESINDKASSISDSIRNFAKPIDDSLRENIGKPLEKQGEKMHSDHNYALKIGLGGGILIAAAPVGVVNTVISTYFWHDSLNDKNSSVGWNVAAVLPVPIMGASKVVVGVGKVAVESKTMIIELAEKALTRVAPEIDNVIKGIVTTGEKILESKAFKILVQDITIGFDKAAKLLTSNLKLGEKPAEDYLSHIFTQAEKEVPEKALALFQGLKGSLHNLSDGLTISKEFQGQLLREVNLNIDLLKLAIIKATTGVAEKGVTTLTEEQVKRALHIGFKFEKVGKFSAPGKEVYRLIDQTGKAISNFYKAVDKYGKTVFMEYVHTSPIIK